MNRIEIKAQEPKKDLEQKYGDARLEVKSEGEGGILNIKAYALAFGNVDSWGDIILPGACDDFLKSEDADRMALCWQHDRATVIGKITDKGVDDYGMWIEADILPTTAGKDAAILLKEGAVKEFSIGWRPDKYHYEHRAGYDYDIRILEAITIVEVSPVTTAANKKAVIISAKADPDHETKEDNNPQNNKTMTPEEIKAMQESIEKAAADKATAQLMAELKAKQEKIDAQAKSIENLDKTAKDQQKAIEDLRVELKGKTPMDFKSAFREELEKARPEIEKAFGEEKANFSIDVELKTVYDIGTGSNTLTANTFLGVQVDPNIHAAPVVPNAFIAAFGIRPRTANKLGWIEATAQNGADYVSELASVASNKSDVAFAEKTRGYAKIAHTMRISTEFEDWFEQLYNYCVNEGVRMIWNKIDDLICNGGGSSSYPLQIWGLDGSDQHTNFSALGTYQDATVADVIFDAAMQIAKEGFNANVAFVTWAIYAQLKGLKDANGNYIFDQARSLLGGLRVYPTARLSSGEIYVVDTTCVEVYAGNSFELEFIRNGLYDAYDVYFRKAVQVKVSTPNKKGVIYVAAAATSQAAISTPGPVAALAGTIDSTDNAIKTKAVAD